MSCVHNVRDFGVWISFPTCSAHVVRCDVYLYQPQTLFIFDCPIKAFLRISYFPCELCSGYLDTKVFLLSTASTIEVVPSQNHYMPFCTLCYATISRGAPRPGDTSASLILRRRHVSFTKTKDARRRHVPGSASLCSLSWELSSRKVDKPCPW